MNVENEFSPEAIALSDNMTALVDWAADRGMSVGDLVRVVAWAFVELTFDNRAEDRPQAIPVLFLKEYVTWFAIVQEREASKHAPLS